MLLVLLVESAHTLKKKNNTYTFMSYSTANAMKTAGMNVRQFHSPHNRKAVCCACHRKLLMTVYAFSIDLN